MKDWEILEELEDVLRGECCCDEITKSDWMDTIADCEEWLETAKPGDVYSYHGYDFELGSDDEEE